MQVKDVMVKNVKICRPEQNLAEVTATMWDSRCGALPVLDSRGTVRGMITDRDICIALGTRDKRASELLVKDVSLPRFFSCMAEDDVLVALRTMVAQNVRRLPVVDRNGEVLGILSIDDLILSAEPEPAGSGISYDDVVNAVKAILNRRFHSSLQESTDLVACHVGAGK
jgi:CBS domain-containing protein